MRQQNTIEREVRCEGIALHCGGHVRLSLLPAPPESGIVFELNDAEGRGEISACAQSVGSTLNATTLERGGRRISTVEHLLASLYALQVDNARVVVDAPELPALDGSAAGFVRLLREAGLVRQATRRPALRVLRRVELAEGDRRISIEPGNVLSISCVIDFAHPAIGRQTLEISELTPEVFEREIAPARTFGFLADVEALRSAGLALGGSLENTLVLDANRPINGDGLRWPDEFVRHKVLDLIGDLALLGRPIQGHVRVERGGHALHHRLVCALLEAPEAWELEADGQGDMAGVGPPPPVTGMLQSS